MRTRAPTAASFLRRKLMYTATWFSAAPESAPQTGARMAALEQLRPSAWNSRRITANSLADSWTCLPPHSSRADSSPREVSPSTRSVSSPSLRTFTAAHLPSPPS